MAENSNIDWTDDTCNVWVGCNWVRLFISEATAGEIEAGGGRVVRRTDATTGKTSYWVPSECDKCYAEWWARVRRRMDGHDAEHPVIWGNPKTTPRIQTKYWRAALRKWNREADSAGRRLVFAFSLADWAEEHPMVGPWRTEWLQLVEQTTHLDHLLLTKRIQNVVRMVPPAWVTERWPAHVWVGTSTGTQAALRLRLRPLERLAELGAPVRFLSVEPLLDPMDLRPALETGIVNWVITGGESGTDQGGPDERPRIDADPDWFRRIRDVCLEYNVAYFHKQAGGRRPGTGKELDGRLWHQWPDTGLGPVGGVRAMPSAELVSQLVLR